MLFHFQMFVNAGDFERVTKMGRVGHRFGDKSRTPVGPKFRKLAFQQGEEDRPVYRSGAPHSSSGVILRVSVVVINTCTCFWITSGFMKQKIKKDIGLA